MAFKSILIILLSIFVLSCIVTIDKGPSLAALADSPPIDHQEIMSDNTNWTQIDVPLQIRTVIPDNRQIYYKTASEITECESKDKKIFNTLPNITSVSYFSDGNTLNTTFWLSKAPLKNHPWQSESLSLSNISQVFLIVEHFPVSENVTNNITQLYPNLNITNYIDDINITKIGNAPADWISFDGTVNDATGTIQFGNRKIKGFSVSAEKDEELYRILYFAEVNDYDKYKRVVENMIRSFQILSSSDDQTKGNLTQLRPLRLYDNANKGIEIDYPSNWNFFQLSQERVLFFSPIDFYFMGTAYVALVDVPSSYDGPTDFIAKLVWWHKFNDRKWAKVIEESSIGGPTRTLEEKHNFTEFFNKTGDWEAYAFMPINLQTINSPNQYLMVFFAGATYVLNGLLCEVIQSTDTVSIPPPKLSILLSSNSSSIGPSIGPLIGPPYSLPQEKSIEVMVKSFSDIPYTISFKNYSSKMVSTNFGLPEMEIPPSGWNTTQLKIKAEWNPGLDSSVTETVPIDANTTRSQLINGTYFLFENKNLSISRPAAVSRIEGSALTITAFNWADHIMNIMNAMRSPLSVLVPLAGIVGGIIAWFLKKEKDKKGNITKDSSQGE